MFVEGILKKEHNAEVEEDEENFEEALKAVNTVITHTRKTNYELLVGERLPSKTSF